MIIMRVICRYETINLKKMEPCSSVKQILNLLVKKGQILMAILIMPSSYLLTKFSSDRLVGWFDS